MYCFIDTSHLPSNKKKDLRIYSLDRKAISDIYVYIYIYIYMYIERERERMRVKLATRRLPFQLLLHQGVGVDATPFPLSSTILKSLV